MCQLRLLALILSVLLGSALVAPGRARADASPSFDFSGVYVPFGLDLGAALRTEGGNGLLLGGEVSGLYFWHKHSLAFVGGYADYLRDFGLGVHRISFGPEAGGYFAGIDAGPVIEFGHGATQLGARARVFGSLGFVALYVGESCRFTTERARWSTEVGLLLKLPLVSRTQENRGWGWGL
jgi:hypothetical protein